METNPGLADLGYTILHAKGIRHPSERSGLDLASRDPVWGGGADLALGTVHRDNDRVGSEGCTETSPS